MKSLTNEEWLEYFAKLRKDVEERKDLPDSTKAFCLDAIKTLEDFLK